MVVIVENSQHAHFFLQGTGGTKKTFLYHVLCNHFQAQEKIVLCITLSDIAAKLLFSGQTSHFWFQIPLILHEDLVTMVNTGSYATNLICQAVLIV